MDMSFPVDQMSTGANKITVDQPNPEIGDYVKRCKDAFMSKIYMTLLT